MSKRIFSKTKTPVKSVDKSWHTKSPDEIEIRDLKIE